MVQIVATVAVLAKRVYKDVHDRASVASVAARCAEIRPHSLDFMASTISTLSIDLRMIRLTSSVNTIVIATA